MGNAVSNISSGGAPPYLPSPEDTLGTLTQAIIIVGALSGEGIASFQNSSGQILNVYYASPGIGVLTVVDPLTNTFIDQIP